MKDIYSSQPLAAAAMSVIRVAVRGGTLTDLTATPKHQAQLSPLYVAQLWLKIADNIKPTAKHTVRRQPDDPGCKSIDEVIRVHSDMEPTQPGATHIRGHLSIKAVRFSRESSTGTGSEVDSTQAPISISAVFESHRVESFSSMDV
jgi:hypothetical protein